jgi:hypothetical protein
MFFVNDNQKVRHQFVLHHLNEETASIAVILACIDFEWTLRRAILLFGKSPTKVIRSQTFQKMKGGYDGYKKAWADEVQPRLKLRIDEVIRNWSHLHGKRGVEKIRGAIVHGASVPISVETARVHVENLLAASKVLENLAVGKAGGSLFRRIVRFKNR